MKKSRHAFLYSEHVWRDSMLLVCGLHMSMYCLAEHSFYYNHWLILMSALFMFIVVDTLFLKKYISIMITMLVM